MAEKPDMFMTMLSKMVGIPPEQFRDTIEGFIYTAQNMGEQMNRIEANQLVLIEAENERRTATGQPLICYVDRNGDRRNGGDASHTNG